MFDHREKKKKKERCELLELQNETSDHVYSCSSVSLCICFFCMFDNVNSLSLLGSSAENLLKHHKLV